MKTINKNIDDLIKESLKEEEEQFYDELDELGVFENFANVLRGKNRWMIILALVLAVVFWSLEIYTFIRFMGANNTNDIIRWAVGMFACFVPLGIIELYYWMEMNKNITLREMKRIELQISILTSKLEKNEND